MHVGEREMKRIPLFKIPIKGDWERINGWKEIIDISRKIRNKKGHVAIVVYILKPQPAVFLVVTGTQCSHRLLYYAFSNLK